MKKTINLENTKSTIKLGKRLSRLTKSCKIFSIKGHLGSGKTTLARGFITSLTKIKTVLSPTFPILLTYEYKNISICHYDLFRVNEPNEIWNINLENSLNHSIVLIEWPEIIENLLPKNRITITLKNDTINSRIAIIEGNKELVNIL